MHKECKELLDKLENEGVKINHDFKFPPRRPLAKRLKDLLEPEVDEKYYLSSDRLKKIKEWEERQKANGRGFRFESTDGNVVGRTVTTSEDRPSSTNYIRVIGKLDIKGQDQIRRVYDTDGVSPTLSTMQGGNRQPKVMLEETTRIRKLTPKECWRLMGFDDRDIEKAEKVNSSTQLYKQAGNSIVVNVLEAILGELL